MLKREEIAPLSTRTDELRHNIFRLFTSRHSSAELIHFQWSGVSSVKTSESIQRKDPSGHMTFIQRRIDTDATFDVNMTYNIMTLHRRTHDVV